MSYITFFPDDSRSSADKLKIIDDGHEQRIDAMRSNQSFQSYAADYWDTGSDIGYGGYRYDGRYRESAERMVAHYGLQPGDRILEVACGKGFLLVEFLKLGMQVAGIEYSEYAVNNAHPEVKPFIRCEDFTESRLEPGGYDLVYAKDCLPHMPLEKMQAIIRNCINASRRHIFFEIEVARNDYEDEKLYQWDITHITRKSPEWWESLLREVNFKGDHHFKVLVEDPRLESIKNWQTTLH